MPAEFSIQPLARDLEPRLRAKIDGKTKPPGALGVLERLALQIGLIQASLTPRLTQPTIVVCAGDHGAAAEAISAFPAEVTAQMVLNFLAGGAAINVFAREHGLALKIVDTGVNARFDSNAAVQGLLDYKIAAGTQNYLNEPAMSAEQCERALANGAAIVDQLHADGCNVIGFGEMGIGNTASAALLMALLLELPLSECVGSGTGLDAAGVRHKTAVLEQAKTRIINAHGQALTPLTALREAGGFEIATICGGLLRAAQQRMLILVDGFIVSAALLVVWRLAPAVIDYCVFSHRSEENAHGRLLAVLGAEPGSSTAPLLDLRLRLGEGTGAALAYPVVRSATAFLEHMASFDSAGVSDASRR